MKFALIFLIIVAVVYGAPVDEAAAKEKRGLALSLGYHHAPFVTHSHYVAPAVVHHAPIISHAPIIHHAPAISYHYPTYHYPAFHSIHHFK